MAPLPIPFWWGSRWLIVPLIKLLLSLKLFPLPLSFGSAGEELITSFCTPSKTSLTCIKLDAPGYNRPKHNTRKGHPTYKTFKTGSIQIVADYRITGEETLSYVVYPKPLNIWHKCFPCLILRIFCLTLIRQGYCTIYIVNGKNHELVETLH